MSALAELGTAHWQAFNALLDRLLDQPPGDRAAWLESLGAEHDPIKPALRTLLARAEGLETGQFLATLPRIPAAATDSYGDVGIAAGDRVGPYRLLRALGQGGMGAVWLAERVDGSLQRQVALKLPRSGWTRGLAQRMARERDILASLEHPGIARLYDAGSDAQGRPYLALEYVEGEPIDVYCRARSLPVRARIELLLQVARAVAYAHSRLVIHRDLKPGNILVTADGQVRLLDFGIARLIEDDSVGDTPLTQLAGRALTPDYASPEQIRGAAIGTASDVYSLGVVAFELLTGARPYRLKRGSAAEVEEAVLAADIPLASGVATDHAARRALRGDLDAILAQALRKDVAQRYASVEALADDFARHQAGQTVTARPDRSLYRLRKFARRNAVAVSAAGAVLLALAIGGGAAAWQAGIALEQARIAREKSAAAERDAKQAKAVQKFMTGIFLRNSHLQADPIRAQSTTARELLDIGAREVSADLKDAPEAQLEVIGHITDVYTQLGLSDQAVALMREGTAVARRLRAPDDPRLADWLLTASQTLQQHGAYRDEAGKLLVEARAILDRGKETTSFLRGALLYETARFHRDGSLPALMQAADEARHFFAAHHPARATRLSSVRLAGRARMFAFDPAAAEALFAEAVALARARPEGSDAWLVGPLIDLSDAQWQQWKWAAAEHAARESVARSTRINGERHPETLLSTLKLAALLMRSGRLEEGQSLTERALSTVHDPASRIRSSVAANARGIAATAWLDLGMPAAAQPELVADVEDLRRVLPGSGALAGRLHSLAQVASQLGRHAHAQALLAESEAVWRSYVGPQWPAGSVELFALAHARLALARGDHATALSRLAAVPEASATEPRPTRVAAEIERAAALLAASEPRAAMAAAERALAAIGAADSERLPLLRARALTALGRAQQQSDAVELAGPTLRLAQQLLARHAPADSLWAREAAAAQRQLQRRG